MAQARWIDTGRDLPVRGARNYRVYVCTVCVEEFAKLCKFPTKDDYLTVVGDLAAVENERDALAAERDALAAELDLASSAQAEKLIESVREALVPAAKTTRKAK